MYNVASFCNSLCKKARSDKNKVLNRRRDFSYTRLAASKDGGLIVSTSVFNFILTGRCALSYTQLNNISLVVIQTLT